MKAIGNDINLKRVARGLDTCLHDAICPQNVSDLEVFSPRCLSYGFGWREPGTGFISENENIEENRQ